MNVVQVIIVSGSFDSYLFITECAMLISSNVSLNLISSISFVEVSIMNSMSRIKCFYTLFLSITPPFRAFLSLIKWMLTKHYS